jgi:hypothetical protein
MAENLTVYQVQRLVEKAFAAGFHARAFYLDWPNHEQAFMDWCDEESDRMNIVPGDVPVWPWIKEQ